MFFYCVLTEGFFRKKFFCDAKLLYNYEIYN